MREISLDELSEHLNVYLNDNNEIIVKLKSNFGVDSTKEISIQTLGNMVLNTGDKLYLNSSPVSLGVMDIDEIVKLSQEAYMKSLSDMLDRMEEKCQECKVDKGA